MAKEHRNQISDARSGPDSKYPLRDWFNGNVWELVQSVDFPDVSLSGFCQHLRRLAATRGYKLSIRTVDRSKGTISVQRIGSSSMDVRT